MSLLTVVKDVSMMVGVALPTSVFANIASNRTMQEMVSLANEMAQRIAYDYRDWTKLRRMATLVGDGVTTAFPLPSNYKRMLLTSNVWRSTSYMQPMMFVPDTDEWMRRRALDRYASHGEWTMMGGQIYIYPPLGVSETATFAYLDKNCVALAGGGLGETFIADDDSSAISDRLLKLGMIWQWKAHKGGPYAEDMNTYGDALTIEMGKDGPAPILVGKSPISSEANMSYPFPAPTGYIPP